MIEDFGQVSISLGVKDFFPCWEDVVFNGREESDVSNATNTDNVHRSPSWAPHREIGKSGSQMID